MQKICINRSLEKVALTIIGGLSSTSAFSQQDAKLPPLPQISGSELAYYQPISALSEVEKRWIPEKHLYTFGNNHVNELQAKKLDQWLKDKKWVVFISDSTENYSYTDAMSQNFTGVAALKKSIIDLKNSAKFQSIKDPKTGFQANNLILISFEKSGFEKKQGGIWWGSELYNKYGVGNKSDQMKLLGSSLQPVLNGAPIYESLKTVIEKIDSSLELNRRLEEEKNIGVKLQNQQEAQQKEQIFKGALGFLSVATILTGIGIYFKKYMQNEKKKALIARDVRVYSEKFLSNLNRAEEDFFNHSLHVTDQSETMIYKGLLLNFLISKKDELNSLVESKQYEQADNLIKQTHPLPDDLSIAYKKYNPFTVTRPTLEKLFQEYNKAVIETPSEKKLEQSNTEIFTKSSI